MRRNPTSFRLSDDIVDLLKRLASHHGISEADVLGMALRRMARVDLSESGWPALAILDAAAAVLGKQKAD